MDKTAIEQIQQAASIEQAVEAIREAMHGRASDSHVPVVALPANFSLHDLEKFLPMRARFRGKFETPSISAFAEYVDRFGSDDSRVFVNESSMTATAVLDIGTPEAPGHCESRARLSPEKTAAYAALLEADGKRMPQKEAAEWLEDWADFISAYYAEGDLMELKKAVSAIRRLTIESASKTVTEEQAYRATQSKLESIEAKADDGLPAELRFMCEPYIEFTSRSFYLRMSIGTGGDKPTIRFTIKGLENMRQAIAGEMVYLIRKNIEVGTVILGTFAAN